MFLKKMLYPILLSLSIYAQEEVSIPSQFPYEIVIDNECSLSTDPVRECNIYISQKGKILYKQNNYDIKPIFYGDMNSDGYKEVVFQGFSGFRHCCFDLIIVSLKPDISKVYHLPTNNTEFIAIKDINNDKKAEIITWDDQYSYGFGLCFACSIGVKVILVYDGSKLKLDPILTAKYTKHNSDNFQVSKVILNEYGNVSIDSTNAPKVLDSILYNLYSGNTSNAILLIKKYFSFENTAVRKLFLLALIDMMSKSPFWKDIKLVNGWYEEGLCFSENCTPPIEIFSKSSVVSWLFEKTS
jgi:hypothetical protein